MLGSHFRVVRTDRIMYLEPTTPKATVELYLTEREVGLSRRQSVRKAHGPINLSAKVKNNKQTT